MKSGLFLFLALFVAGASAEEAKPREVRLAPPAGLTRADLYVFPGDPHPQAILVLCPGANGNGRGLLTPAWADFARKYRLGMVALSFASENRDLQGGKGYYYPAQGSGQALLDGLKTIYGRDLPLLLYGMSGGAHFTARFTEWRPERVISWCAYSAGWWDLPRFAAANPPGIVACGDEDVRYGATLGYFLQGRALGKPWTWVSLARTGHQSSRALDEFTRTYFASILDPKAAHAEWRDVDLKNPVDGASVRARPTLACWLPDEGVARSWMKVHQP